MCRLRLAVENGHSIIMTVKLWFYSNDFIMTRGSLDEPLHTNIYTSMPTQTGMYALYFHTTELSNGQMFHKVQSYQVTFIWPVRGNVESKWTCQCFDCENCSIWIEEEDSGNDKLDKGGDQETEEERIRWWQRSRWQTSQRRGQWRLHKNRPFCMDLGWDWTSAETTTSVID